MIDATSQLQTHDVSFFLLDPFGNRVHMRMGATSSHTHGITGAGQKLPMIPGKKLDLNETNQKFQLAFSLP